MKSQCRILRKENPEELRSRISVPEKSRLGATRSQSHNSKIKNREATKSKSRTSKIKTIGSARLQSRKSKFKTREATRPQSREVAKLYQ